MITLREVDSEISLQQQMADETDQVVLVNTFLVPEGRRDAVLAAWTADAEFMLSRPGCLSTQLHEGIGGSHALVNVAVWTSAAALREAFDDPQFRESLGRYPDGTISSPHLYRKLAVEGICAD